MNTKEYLGDSVYADIDNGSIKLTTENGGYPSNIIYLETYTALELIEYIKKWMHPTPTFTTW